MIGPAVGAEPASAKLLREAGPPSRTLVDLVSFMEGRPPSPGYGEAGPAPASGPVIDPGEGDRFSTGTTRTWIRLAPSAAVAYHTG